MANKLLKYGLMVAGCVFVVLMFVLSYATITGEVLVFSSSSDIMFGDLAESEVPGALPAYICAIVLACVAGITLLLAVCCDLKVLKLYGAVKLVGIVCLVVGLACLISGIVMTADLADSYTIDGFTTITFGFGSVCAFLGGLFFCGGVFVPQKKKKKATRKKKK